MRVVLQLRISVPDALSADVVEVLGGDPAVSSLAVLRGSSVKPPGDVVLADVAREAANGVVDQLRHIGVAEAGTLQLEPVSTWVSQAGFRAEQRAPGSGADAVVWSSVVQHAYEDSELNWTYLSFLSMATLLASIAIVLDSQVLVIGAMVLGPEFGAVAALGVALVRRRRALLRFAARTLVLGFLAAIAVATLVAFAGRALGWVVLADVVGPRPGTSFVYTPDRWSLVVALLAGAAGVLSVTSARIGGLSGVFISVTTVPAAGNVALGLAFGVWDEVRGSALQLAVNIAGMAVAGWLTLALQQAVWRRVVVRRVRVPGAAFDA
jgi:uncharacterized hydrophobic protein (TIGR00271 family)